MVYRPPRKKLPPEPPGSRFPANQPSADPLEGPLQGATHVEDPRAGDDRNLVVVDQSFAEADFEDRAWLFWQKQRKVIFGLVALACLGGLGWGGWYLYQKHAQAELQAAYQLLDGPAAYQAFAQAHPDTGLGRMALLQAADDLYTQGQFKEAAPVYAQAASAWQGEPVAQRARMGHALALLLGGDAAGGRQELETLASDNAVLDNFRAEAGYYVAVLSLQAGDIAGAHGWIERVAGLPEAGSWGHEATDLAQIAPSLGLVKAGAPSLAPQNSISAPGLSPLAPMAPPSTSSPSSASAPYSQFSPLTQGQGQPAPTSPAPAATPPAK